MEGGAAAADRLADGTAAKKRAMLYLEGEYVGSSSKIMMI